eukprot:Em0001g2925a
MTGSYPVGYRTLQYGHGASARPQKLKSTEVPEIQTRLLPITLNKDRSYIQHHLRHIQHHLRHIQHHLPHIQDEAEMADDEDEEIEDEEIEDEMGEIENEDMFTMLYSETPDMSECVSQDQGTQVGGAMPLPQQHVTTSTATGRQHHQMHQQGPRPMDHQMHQQVPRPMDHQMHQQVPRPMDHQRFMLTTPRVDIRYQPYPPRAGGGGGGRPVALGSQLDGWM